MGKYDEVKKEIMELIDSGTKLYENVRSMVKEQKKYLGIFDYYEEWYTKALNIIKQLQPQRYDDFVKCYKNDKRKIVDDNTYVISDYLKGYFPRNIDCGYRTFLLIRSQVKILATCLQKFDSTIYSLENLLQADVFDSEIESAKHLLKNGFLRAAGAICGVVLEKHLSKICDSRGVIISKKDPSISDFNEKLKDVAYDTIEWRKIQGLADLRNLCDHKKDREPTKEDVQTLIAGTERVIKSLF